MNDIFSGSLHLGNMFEFLNKPRDLTKEEFTAVVFAFTLTEEKIIKRCAKEDNLWDVLVDIGFFKSKSDIRRIGFNQSDFFETGIEDLKLSVVRKGKKEHELIFKYN